MIIKINIFTNLYMQKCEIKFNDEIFVETTFMGISVITDSDGYYQASKICKDNNKLFNDWRRIKRTVKLLQRYSNLLKIDIERPYGNSRRVANASLLYKTPENYPNNIRGYYIIVYFSNYQVPIV